MVKLLAIGIVSSQKNSPLKTWPRKQGWAFSFIWKTKNRNKQWNIWGTDPWNPYLNWKIIQMIHIICTRSDQTVSRLLQRFKIIYNPIHPFLNPYTLSSVISIDARIPATVLGWWAAILLHSLGFLCHLELFSVSKFVNFSHSHRPMIHPLLWPIPKELSASSTQSRRFYTVETWSFLKQRHSYSLHFWVLLQTTQVRMFCAHARQCSKLCQAVSLCNLASLP